MKADTLNYTNLERLQFWLLAAISVALVWTAPDVWHFTPDSGIYVGTADSLARDGAYWFNGYPNLQYYPGLSVLLSLTILVFGVDFQVMHLLSSIIVVACLWLSRSYFSFARYGVAGLAVPVVLASSQVLLLQAFQILSDGLFLAVVLVALLLWRRSVENFDRKAFVACCVVVAAAPMIRYQGLFLVAAFCVGYLLETYRAKGFNVRALAVVAIVCAAVILPFALWTWRNLALHTPDAFNLLNGYFFGLGGLSLNAPSSFQVDWVDADWKFTAYRILYFVTALPEMLLGQPAVRLFTYEAWFIFVVGLAAAGSVRWFKLGSSVERLYVLVSALFLFYWMLKGGRSLNIVARYWLPILPFAWLAMGLGLRTIYRGLTTLRVRYAVPVLATGLVSFGLVTATGRVSTYVGTAEYFQNAQSVLSRMSDYVAAHVPADAKLATTDWGVLPYTLNRQSYQTLNDASHVMTLRRMNKYRTQYLAVLDGLTKYPLYARKMVEKYPEVFTLVFEARPSGIGPVGSVYGVALPALERLVDRNANAARQ